MACWFLESVFPCLLFFLGLCDVHDLLYLLFILDLGLIFLGLSPQPVSACEWCLVSLGLLGVSFRCFMFVRVWLREVCLFPLLFRFSFLGLGKKDLSSLFSLMLLVFMLIVYWFWQRKRQRLLHIKKGVRWVVWH